MSTAEGGAYGLCAFVTTILGYSFASRLVRSQWARPVRAAKIEEPQSSYTYKVGLLDLTVPSKRETNHINLLLANDICIERAVQAVGKRLYVHLHEKEVTEGDVSKGGPELRCYLSELYSQFWDLCYLHGNLRLDVIIMSGPLRDETLMRPELQVVMAKGSEEQGVRRVNLLRLKRGLPPLAYEPLDSYVALTLSTRFHFVEDETCEIPRFPRVAVGGTFDRLHNGHKKLLSLAASVTQARLTVGITSSEMLRKKKNADLIEPVEERVEAVTAFLRSVAPRLELDIVVINDPFGPPVHKPDFEAIVVSSETIAGAVKINEIRQSKGFTALEIVVTRRTVSSLLSSTFIRKNLPKQLPPS